jgi:hypothetical protein
VSTEQQPGAYGRSGSAPCETAFVSVSAGDSDAAADARVQMQDQILGTRRDLLFVTGHTAGIWNFSDDFDDRGRRENAV